MMEFVTAQNTRPGQDPYVKPCRACEKHPGKSYQSSKMAVRHVWSRTGHQEPVYHTPLPPKNWNRLWIAVKVEDANPLCIKAPVSRDVSVRSHQNDRLTLFRTQELMRHVFGRCEDVLNSVSQEMQTHTVTGMQEKGRYLANFLPLVQRLTGEEVPELPSTEWRPIAGINVTTPSEIKGCACARLDKFPVYLSKGCKGISMYNVTQATRFATPDLLLPALLHTAKGVLMSDLRCCTVAAEGVQRGRVFRDQPETFRVAATSRNVQGHEGERAWRADESISGSVDQTTDKHKAIWLCELKIVQEALESAGAQGSGAFGQNVGKKHGGKGGETQR